MARLILDINPAREPERARKAVDSHLARARWMTEVGYRHLAAGRYPDPQRDQAEQVELLRSLGIITLPPDGRTRPNSRPTRPRAAALFCSHQHPPMFRRGRSPLTLSRKASEPHRGGSCRP